MKNVKTNKTKKFDKDGVIIMLSIIALILGIGVVDSMVTNPTPLSVGIFAICFVYLLLVAIANSL